MFSETTKPRLLVDSEWGTQIIVPVDVTHFKAAMYPPKSENAYSVYHVGQYQDKPEYDIIRKFLLMMFRDE